jgi:uncharacterized membrane protein
MNGRTFLGFIDVMASGKVAALGILVMLLAIVSAPLSSAAKRASDGGTSGGMASQQSILAAPKSCELSPADAAQRTYQPNGTEGPVIYVLPAKLTGAILVCSCLSTQPPKMIVDQSAIEKQCRKR